MKNETITLILSPTEAENLQHLINMSKTNEQKIKLVQDLSEHFVTLNLDSDLQNRLVEAFKNKEKARMPIVTHEIKHCRSVSSALSAHLAKSGIDIPPTPVVHPVIPEGHTRLSSVLKERKKI